MIEVAVPFWLLLIASMAIGLRELMSASARKGDRVPDLVPIHPISGTGLDEKVAFLSRADAYSRMPRDAYVVGVSRR
jgi:hypothetical protein